MASRQDVQDASGRLQYNPGYGQMHAWGSAAPSNGQKGFSPGCIFQNLAGTIGSCFYVNVGTFTSSQWINVENPDGTIISLITTTTITAAVHAGRTLLLSLAGGFTSTLPLATGTGLIYRFMVGIVSSTGYLISASGSDVFKGVVQIAKLATTYDNVGAAESFASTTNVTITLNATTKGGLSIGDWVQVQDVLSGVWSVTALLSGSGSLATPFS